MLYVTPHQSSLSWAVVSRGFQLSNDCAKDHHIGAQRGRDKTRARIF